VEICNPLDDAIDKNSKSKQSDLLANHSVILTLKIFELITMV
jgi:hypothetical protein